jgi:hypothetical protein
MLPPFSFQARFSRIDIGSSACWGEAGWGSLSRRRPEARSDGRAEVPAGAAATERAGAAASPYRDQACASGVAPERMPRVRHRRGGRPPLPHDGVRRWRTRVATEAHRSPSAAEGDRCRPPVVCRAGGGTRDWHPPPRSEAKQCDARRQGSRANHGLRPRNRHRAHRDL